MPVVNPTTFPGTNDYGLIINNFKFGNSANAFQDLIGIGDGTCPAYTGNKLDDLFSYMDTKDYNYAIFKDTQLLRNGNLDEYTPAGIAAIENAIIKGRAHNVTKFAPAISMWYWGTNPAIPPGFGYQTGISEYKMAVHYNNNCTPGNEFTNVFFDDAWWDFEYDQRIFGAAQANFTGYIVEMVPNTPGNFNNVFPGMWVNINRYWRQVVAQGPPDINGDIKLVIVDRPTNVGFPGGTVFNQPYYYLTSAHPDFDTYTFRLDQCAQYSPTMYFDAFVGIPSGTFKGTLTPFRGGQVGEVWTAMGAAAPNTRIIYKMYERLPAFTYDATPTGLTIEPLDANYNDNSGSAYNRVSDDLAHVADGHIGFAVSIEHAERNYLGYRNCERNYSGYFESGRSEDGATIRSQAFLPLDSAGLATPNTAAINPAPANCTPSAVPYNPETAQKTWRYVVGVDAAGTPVAFSAGNDIAGVATTFNSACVSGGAYTSMNSNLFLNCMIYDNQEFIRYIETVLPLSISAVGHSPTCFGDLGSATSLVTGGVGPYTFLWTPGGSTDQNPTGLTPNTYTVTVTDSLANTATSNPIIIGAAPAELRLDVFSTDTNGCVVNGVNVFTGTLTASNSEFLDWPPCMVFTHIQGGGQIPNGSTVWEFADITSTPPDQIKTWTGLMPGIWTVCASACNVDCYVCHDATISEAFMSVIGVPTPTTCVDAHDGIIDVTVTNGLAPYYIELLDFATSTILYDAVVNDVDGLYTFTNVAAGNYIIRATDASGCQVVSGEVVLIDAIPITPPIPFVTNETCPGNYDGTITVVIGPLPSPTVNLYTCSPGGILTLYQSDNSSPFVFTGLTAGEYCVQTSYNSGTCLSPMVHVDVGVEDVQANYVVTPNTGCGEMHGAITLVSITGSPSDYDIIWSGPNGFFEVATSISNLASGTYYVTLTNLITGCIKTLTYVVLDECPNFTMQQLKITLFNAECCFAEETTKLSKELSLGKSIATLCSIRKIKLLWMLIQRLEALETVLCNPNALDCTDVEIMMDRIKDLCDCNCDGTSLPATYEPSTNTIIIN